MSFHGDAIFWIEVEKIGPNPYQPRREFDEGKLQELADSIQQYGVLQPLVVTRKEIARDDGGLHVQYELIAGERRLRASKIAGVSQVPVVIRSDEESDNVKLELAVIENLQREDLNSVERAEAFARLAEEFGYTHGEIGKKVGKSRVYVSNTIRILGLPDDIRDSLRAGKIKEGHTRPLLMLSHKPDEQGTLYKDIILNNMTVRDAEQISRRLAVERTRSYDPGIRPDIREFETQIGEQLGTRVLVKKNHSGGDGGKVVINFSSEDDLQKLMSTLKAKLAQEGHDGVFEEAPEGAVDSQERDGDEEGDLYSISGFSL